MAVANPLFDALFAPLSGRGDALLILPDGARIAGDAFLRLVARQAHALRAAGVGPGDRIAALAAKSPEALALYGAALALGAVLVPFNPGCSDDEAAHVLGDAAPRAVVCDPARAAALSARAVRGAAMLTLGADGTGSLAEAAAGLPGAVAPAPRAPDDLAALLYTSGTTGRPKGAMLTHANLLSNARALADLWRFGPGDVLLHALPIFHTHGLFVACNVGLLTGGALLFLPGFDAGAVLRLLPRATAMMGVPTFYTRLLAEPGLTRAAVAGVRLFVSGSAPLPEATHRAFERRTGHRILERYGMTETSMIASNPHDGERRAGAVGLPLPGVEVRIADPGADGAGGIEVRGPNVFRGYWRMPGKTAEAMRPGGWFATGDIGRFDADGYLSIVGRSTDLVITGGFNVYPREVEAVLDALPGVRESAVIGLPHPDLGEAVFAAVVADPGTEVATLEAGMAERLARYKRPKGCALMEALPRNAMGKVQKAALRAAFAGRFTA